MSQKTAPSTKSAAPRQTAAPRAKAPATSTKVPGSRPSGSRSTRRALEIEAGTHNIPRATAGHDDDDVLVSGGTIVGQGYGRCGGRVLASRIEQQLCMLLSRNGVTHSHSPRHFEVRYKDLSDSLSKQDLAKNIAAYAPMIVLRGRGREGKVVVIEASNEVQTSIMPKIMAFRRQYGVEFYVIFVAPEEILDEIPFDAYDESCTTNDVATLINRLAD